MSFSSRACACAITVSTALAATAVTGCGGYRSSPAPIPCEPSASTSLPAGASVATLAGRYRLALAATSGPGSGSRVEGELTLAPAPGEMVAALVGRASVAVESVGALKLGDLGSSDPMRPGVLVFEQAGDGPRRILLRLGSEANRRDMQPFESGYTVLEVREMTDDGFRGSWRSGVRETEAEGYFCAARTGD